MKKVLFTIAAFALVATTVQAQNATTDSFPKFSQVYAGVMKNATIGTHTADGRNWDMIETPMFNYLAASDSSVVEVYGYLCSYRFNKDRIESFGPCAQKYAPLLRQRLMSLAKK